MENVGHGSEWTRLSLWPENHTAPLHYLGDRFFSAPYIESNFSRSCARKSTLLYANNTLIVGKLSCPCCCTAAAAYCWRECAGAIIAFRGKAYSSDNPDGLTVYANVTMINPTLLRLGKCRLAVEFCSRLSFILIFFTLYCA